ncbi:MAG: GNAT family N-acetyltransferase, partial [Thermoprotei archaeon]
QIFERVEGFQRVVDLFRRAFNDSNWQPMVIASQQACEKDLESQLLLAGYRQIDELSVMNLTEPIKPRSHGFEVTEISGTQLNSWCEVYLKSFYGSVDLLPLLSPVVSKCEADPRTTFLLAFKQMIPVGGLVLYRTESLLGAYCVGTLPEYRGHGVASSLLAYSSDFAVEHGLQLILQTFIADGVEPMYRRLGFKRVYVKKVFEHQTDGTAAEQT